MIMTPPGLTGYTLAFGEYTDFKGSHGRYLPTSRCMKNYIGSRTWKVIICRYVGAYLYTYSLMIYHLLHNIYISSNTQQHINLLTPNTIVINYN